MDDRRINIRVVADDVKWLISDDFLECFAHEMGRSNNAQVYVNICFLI